MWNKGQGGTHGLRPLWHQSHGQVEHRQNSSVITYECTFTEEFMINHSFSFDDILELLQQEDLFHYGTEIQWLRNRNTPHRITFKKNWLEQEWQMTLEFTITQTDFIMFQLTRA
jgi:hypothetical protein